MTSIPRNSIPADGGAVTTRRVSSQHPNPGPAPRTAVTEPAPQARPRRASRCTTVYFRDENQLQKLEETIKRSNPTGSVSKVIQQLVAALITAADQSECQRSYIVGPIDIYM